MKILMINVTCGRGSTGRISTDLADALIACGHEVKTAYGRGSVPEKYRGIAVRIGSDTGVRVHALKARLFDAAGFGSRAATKRFIEWAREYDPDIIHLHNIHGYYVNAEELFRYLSSCGKRVIWTLHDCWAFTGHSANCLSASCEKWTEGCGSCPKKAAYPKSFVDRSQYNWERKRALFTGVPEMELVVPSEWLKGLAERSFLGKYPVRHIPNGVDDSVFRPTESGVKEEMGIGGKKLVLGAASVWTAEKGLDDLIGLRSLLDKDEYAIALVGLTKKQIRSLPGGVIGIERTESVRALAGLYSAADVFVNPTYDDNFPTTNLEALACGTPVVTYATGGSPEAAGETAGAVVPTGDVNALAERIKGLSAPREACLLRARSFTKERMTAAYLGVYFGNGGEAK